MSVFEVSKKELEIHGAKEQFITSGSLELAKEIFVIFGKIKSIDFSPDGGAMP